MGKFYDSIPPNFVKWIEAQQMFWVASAPLSAEGHVNVSPKGLRGTLHIVNENQVWYQDNTGSGSETAAHMKEPGNARITLMFSAFEGTPRIVRLFGHGRVHEFGTPEYDSYIPPGTRRPGSRSVIVVDIHKVGQSCGFGVPLYNFVAQRNILIDHAAKGEDRDREFEEAHKSANGSGISNPDSPPPICDTGLKAFWVKENMKSIDGLPSLTFAPISGVPPIHAPPEKWSEPTSAQTSSHEKAVATTRYGNIWGNSNLSREEVVRLVFAFSLGLAVAAVYVQYTGC